MLPKSKKRLAVVNREAKKPENVSAATSTEAYSPPQYKPLDPLLQPYWDAFYKNSYPDAEECRILSERLNMNPQVILEWFGMARRFTHAAEKNSDDNSGELEVQDVENEDMDEEDNSIKGTLYEYFYQDVMTQKSNTHSALKRKWFNPEATTMDPGALRAEKLGVVEPKVTQRRGPKGPYTKQSHMTLWRREKHARKHASPIQSYFPVVGDATKKPRVGSSAYIIYSISGAKRWVNN
ncbi:hypothetical protein FRC11_000581 [Ceratobasidium sp. 423]|nr:hypothetical protein FRC11_000581 [Ceratobasidium sp. 423]